VDPGGAELNERKSSEEASERDEEISKNSGEDAHEDAREKALNYVDAKTAEVGATAAVGTEETVDGPER
jgi:hypothetical protein